MSDTGTPNGKIVWSLVSLAVNGLVGLLLMMGAYLLDTQEDRLQVMESSLANERYQVAEFRGKVDRWLAEQDRRLSEILDEVQLSRKP